MSSSEPLGPLLSIVVACEPDAHDPDSPTSDISQPPAWLAAARAAQEALHQERGQGTSELIVVGYRDIASPPSWAHDGERWIPASPSMLVPARWAVGMKAAKGDAIGLTIDRCLLPREWGLTGLAALARGFAGVGGGFVLAPGSSALDAAIYHLRYGAFPPGRERLAETRGDIAGDNAMYSADALQSVALVWADAFWEVEVHRVLREREGRLALVPAMDVAFGGTRGVGIFLRHRFEHGMHSGAWRRRGLGLPLARLLLAAPLVPIVLCFRGLRRARTMDRGTTGFMRSLPFYLLLASAWAAGEAMGALRVKHMPRHSSPKT